MPDTLAPLLTALLPSHPTAPHPLFALSFRSQGSGLPNRTKMFESCGMGDVPVWGLISEDILTEEAKLPEGYVDDGEEH